MSISVSKELNEFLSIAHIAVISTIDEFGLPWSAPIWFDWKDESATMFTSVKTRKWRNSKFR